MCAWRRSGSARAADRHELKLLDIEPGAPVLTAERTSFEDHDVRTTSTGPTATGARFESKEEVALSPPLHGNDFVRE